MSSVLSRVIFSFVVFAAIASVLFVTGTIIVSKGIVSKEEMKRAITSLIVFAVIYLGSEFVIGNSVYDVYVKAIEFLAAVVGAGCYWVGSNRR